MEGALSRGLAEEIGVENARIRRFIGSVQTKFHREDGTLIDKTTIYFEVTSATPKVDLRKLEPDELQDQIIWMFPNDALALLQEQQNDEHKIIQTVIGFKA